MNKDKRITNIFYDIREVRIVNNLRLKSIHKLVLFVLESRGGRIYPTKVTIANDCGCSKATIDKAIKELEAADLLRVKRQFNSSNWYFINKKAIQKEADRIRVNEILIKEELDCHKLPEFDPWEKDISNDQSKEFLVNHKISNDDILKEMWDNLNSNPSHYEISGEGA
jgi:DNA-binding MarR family transcriptional regulator